MCKKHDTDGRKPKYSEKNLFSDSLSTTNPTLTAERLNPCFDGKRPATNRLRHGTPYVWLALQCCCIEVNNLRAEQPHSNSSLQHNRFCYIFFSSALLPDLWAAIFSLYYFCLFEWLILSLFIDAFSAKCFVYQSFVESLWIEKKETRVCGLN
jgi:hypothetical protein